MAMRAANTQAIALTSASSTASPPLNRVFSQDPQRPIPILLQAETIDTTLPVEVARQQLTTALRSFLVSVDLDSLTQPYRRR